MTRKIEQRKQCYQLKNSPQNTEQWFKKCSGQIDNRFRQTWEGRNIDRQIKKLTTNLADEFKITVGCQLIFALGDGCESTNIAALETWVKDQHKHVEGLPIGEQYIELKRRLYIHLMDIND